MLDVLLKSSMPIIRQLIKLGLPKIKEAIENKKTETGQTHRIIIIQNPSEKLKGLLIVELVNIETAPPVVVKQVLKTNFELSETGIENILEQFKEVF